MKFLFFILFFFNNIFASDNFIDLGIQGSQYEIVEENGIDFIDRKLKDVNQTMIKETYQKEIDNSFFPRLKIKISKRDTNTSRANIHIARWDIISPNGDLILKKGEVIPSKSLHIIPFSLCFIDGGMKKNVVIKVIKKFGRKCYYFVNNIDSRKFKNIYNIDAFPMGGQNKIYADHYLVDKLPTKIHVTSNIITTTTLDMIKIYKKVKNEKLNE